MPGRKLRPAGMPEIDWRYRYVVYRFYDQDGAPVYFGATRNWHLRWKQHRKKPWWPRVARVKITLHPTPDMMGQAEKRYILRELPPHNLVPRPCPNLDYVAKQPDHVWTSEDVANFHSWRQWEFDQARPNDPAKVAVRVEAQEQTPERRPQ